MMRSGGLNMDMLMSSSEMEHYIEQLESENLRLKQINSSLRTNNRGLLEGHKKLQRCIHKLKSKIEYLEEILEEIQHEKKVD